MKKSTKQLIALGSVAAGVALGAAGWKLSRMGLDPSHSRYEPAKQAARGSDAIADAAKAAADWFDHQNGEPVYIASHDGLTLRGTVLHPPVVSHKWAVLVHGYTSRRDSMGAYARHYLEAGYHVLAVDLRAHGESGGKAIGMGWDDRTDLLRWLNFVTTRDPYSEIVLHGVSMGATTVLMASGEPMPVQVKAIISDSAFSTAWRQFSNVLHRRRLLAFPLLIPAAISARIWGGYWFPKVNALRAVRRSVTPTLFIHGGDDDFVDPQMLASLYDACSAPKEWFLMPDCGHVAAQYRDPEHYWERVDGFIARQLEAEANDFADESDESDESED